MSDKMRAVTAVLEESLGDDFSYYKLDLKPLSRNPYRLRISTQICFPSLIH